MAVKHHKSEAGYQIAYQHTKGEGVGVVFIHGFRSDMEGSKAVELQALCEKHNIPFTRFDIFAHGVTGGDFLEYTIGHGVRDTLEILDHVATGDQILVGSSMGGWIMLCAALERKHQVRGLIGIAAAPDFTERFPSKMTPEELKQINEEGVIWRMSEYWGKSVPTTKNLLDEGRNHLLLDHPIPLDIPVHLLHGQRDEDVPWQLSMQVMETLTSSAVEVTLVKDGDHRLSRPQDMEILKDAVLRMQRMFT
jgi:pimeloyl-ACP methyl ester carboxylesterase